jgi:hypothetical protein
MVNVYEGRTQNVPIELFDKDTGNESCPNSHPSQMEHPMGLGSVEIMLGVEDTFSIHIPDDMAAAVRTSGDIIDFVSSKVPVAISTSGACASQRLFDLVQKTVPASDGDYAAIAALVLIKFASNIAGATNAKLECKRSVLYQVIQSNTSFLAASIV